MLVFMLGALCILLAMGTWLFEPGTPRWVTLRRADAAIFRCFIVLAVIEHLSSGRITL